MESLSLILLIPFSVCFLLLFVVCCFAQEIKNMCRMPSQIPHYYVGSDDRQSRRRRRHRSRHEMTHEQMVRRGDDEALIGRFIDRSRNSSGSSSDIGAVTNVNFITVVTTQPDGQTFASVVETNSLLSASQTITITPILSVSQTNLSEIPHGVT